MFARLVRRFLHRGDVPARELRGRPAIRREKSYAADSGYVYQYTYEGYRPATRDGVEGRQFVFDCTSDRASRFAISIFAPADSFAEWERSADRELNDVERYAVVKMRLFELLDGSEHVRGHLEAQLSADQVERHVEALDL